MPFHIKTKQANAPALFLYARNMSVVANPYFAPSICGESCMGESLGIWWDKKFAY